MFHDKNEKYIIEITYSVEISNLKFTTNVKWMVNKMKLQ